MAKVEHDSEGSVIAYVPKQDNKSIPVYFITYNECAEYCRMMNEQGYHLIPITEYYLIGLPQYINWTITKANGLYAIYYDYSELEF